MLRRTLMAALFALPALAALDDTRHSIDFRARSYLGANCSPCHQLGTGLPSSFDARHDVPLSLTGLVDARKVLDEFADAFVFTRFEPNGMVQGHDQIKMVTVYVHSLGGGQ